MRRHALVLVALLVANTLTAQSSAPRASSDGVMLAFQTFANIFGYRLVAAFDSIPATRYDFRPTPPQQTIGYVAQHLEAANYGLCQQLGELKHLETAKDSLADTVKARWPKDTLVVRLKASLQFCDSVIQRMGKLESGTRANVLLAFETDLAEHYSQIASYMRLLGMVPPSALPPPTRTTIALRESALAQYVGVYELTPELRFDVALRDVALFITSTANGVTRQLWPESDSDFFLKDVDAQVTFTRDARGAVTGLVVHQNGYDRPAKRIR